MEKFLKLDTLVGGIFGAFIGLYYTKPLTGWSAIMAAFGGIGCALFLSPLITHIFAVPVMLQPTVGFIVGMVGMGIVGIVFQVLSLAKKNPIRTLRQLLGMVISVLLAFRHGIDATGSLRDDAGDEASKKDKEDSSDGD